MYLVRSPFFAYIKQRISTAFSSTPTRYRYPGVKHSDADSEAQTLREGEILFYGTRNGSESIFRRQDNPTLVFILTKMFLIASLSQFTSALVIFRVDSNGNPDKGAQGVCGKQERTSITPS